MIDKPDLEQDLMGSALIKNKTLNHIYAQNLYACLCNQKFYKNNHSWTCSWRMAGGIVADLRNKGECYTDFYCSGLWDNTKGYVSEGYATDEIRTDLLNLGWTIKPYEPRLEPGVYRNEW